MTFALLRLAAIGAFCAFVVYLTSAAFVPAMGTGAWDFLFIGIASLGLAVGAFSALRELLRKGRRR